MSDTVLQVNNVSKKYCHSLKRSMLYGCSDILRDALGLPIDQNLLRKDEFWSVKDVSFSLERGQCLGIIGPNGAGKSTLLKMLNGIIKPDKGDIWYKGRMGALIEVGAGFQPVLSGKENIFINGSIIGLSNKEIKEKFDEIVAFSGLKEFLDMPVKNYSSGMRVRLGFSIAAHLHPDILLVDEVLAVGDLSFQAKCRNKIADMVRNGTAIILISHNMHHVANLCGCAMTINNGFAKIHETVSSAIDSYRTLCTNNSSSEIGGKEARILQATLLDKNGIENSLFQTNDSLSIKIEFEGNSVLTNPNFAIIIKNTEDATISAIRNDFDNIKFGELKNGVITLHLEKVNLLPGNYNIDIILIQENGFAPYHRLNNALSFQISGGNKVYGFMYLEHSWRVN